MDKQYYIDNHIGVFKNFMPDEFTGNHKTERNFFWTVLTTNAQEYVEQLIIDCR